MHTRHSEGSCTASTAAGSVDEDDDFYDHAARSSLSDVDEDHTARFSECGADEEDCRQLSIRTCVRSRYVNRVIRSVERPPQHQTVTIFDWDDTLLCTSWLVMKEATAPPRIFSRKRWKPDAATASDLAKIEAVALGLVAQAQAMGPTYIVTNGTAEWVSESATKWAPRLLPMLKEVEVISARDEFKRLYPRDMARWKPEAFLYLQRRLPDRLVTNLIVVGDSEFEMDAGRIMSKEFQHPTLKAVRFIPRPTPRQLLAEMEAISKNFATIAATTEDADVSVCGYRP